MEREKQVVYRREMNPIHYALIFSKVIKEYYILLRIKFGGFLTLGWLII